MPTQPAIPITHYFNWNECSDHLRPQLMQEFRVNGAKHLVLTDDLLRRAMSHFEFTNTLLKEIKKADLTFCDAHAPFGNHEDLDNPFPNERPMLIKRLKLILKIVRDLGVKTCTIHVGNAPYREYSLEHYDNCIRQSLEELLPTAETCGIVIAIENIWFPTNTAEKLLSILNHFRSTFLGICYDSGHANLMAKGMNFPESAAQEGWDSWSDSVQWDNQVLEKLSPHIVNCHLHDNFGQYDEHQLPGSGNIDWKYVMKTLARSPRLQCIQNEVDPVRHNIPITTLCRNFDRLSSMM